MAEQEAYNPSLEEIAIGDWISAVLATDYPTAVIRISGQADVRKQRPYVLFRITSLDEGWADHWTWEDPDSPGTFYKSTSTSYTGIVEVSAYGSDSMDIIKRISRSIYEDDSLAVMVSTGVQITQHAGPLLNLSGFLATVQEQRAQRDFSIAFTDLVTSGAGAEVIERVIVSGTISDLTTPPPDIDVSWPT